MALMFCSTNLFAHQYKAVCTILGEPSERNSPYKETPQTFNEEITHWLNSGWICQGGVNITFIPNGQGAYMICQALVKKTK